MVGVLPLHRLGGLSALPRARPHRLALALPHQDGASLRPGSLSRCLTYMPGMSNGTASVAAQAPQQPLQQYYQQQQQQQQQQRVFVFDAGNPDAVQEVMVQPHEDFEAAEQMLQQEEALARQQDAFNGAGAASSSGGGSYGMPAASRRTPMPLRGGPSPLPTRRGTPMAGAGPLSLRSMTSDLVLAGNSPLATAGGQDTTMALAKTAEMQKQLVWQLEREQGQVAHLQQYEGMYREWRMKAERLEADLTLMQRLVAEKDAELAHGYRLLEASATERSRLRHAFQAAQERTKQLQAKLSELQAPMLAGGGPHGLLAAGGSDDEGAPQDGGQAGQPPATLSGMHSSIEELSTLATGLASDMSAEVRHLHSRFADAASRGGSGRSSASSQDLAEFDNAAV